MRIRIEIPAQTLRMSLYLDFRSLSLSVSPSEGEVTPMSVILRQVRGQANKKDTVGPLISNCTC
jgi:hypothetical protein